MTLLCVPIMVHEEASALADAVAARNAGADLVELRVDEFFTGDEPEQEANTIFRLLARSPLPCILTCRIAAEGGGYSGSEADRTALFERLARLDAARIPDGKGETIAAHAPRYVDLEQAAFQKSAEVRRVLQLVVDHSDPAREHSTGLILSVHDFESRPNDLHRRLRALVEEPAAVVIKVAYRARSLRDDLELLDLPRILNRPTISIGMGRFGLMTRVLAPKFGGFLTYASLRPTTVTAPGQPTVCELLETFRFRSIKRTTSVFGVVGWPLEHSLSPAVHNAGFEAIGFDGVFVPMPIASAEDDPEASYASFKATMLELVHHSSLDLRGCAVTIPHKENLLRLARDAGWRVSPVAAAIGAANTLVIRHDHVEVLNTDAPATADVLQHALDQQQGLTGTTVAVLGAGGMARAAVFACADAGANVLVANRSANRARLMIDSFPSTISQRVNVVDVAALARHTIHALINATSVGMSGGGAPDQSPVPLESLVPQSPNLLVMDAVYKPRRTPLLLRARELSLRTVGGVTLFVAQAQRQFQAWTGRSPPAGLFEQAADAALDPTQDYQ